MTVGARWRPESHKLDDNARRAIPGAFVHLSRGYTHYELSGPQEGQTVVLIHGFSVPNFIWDPTFRFLATAGFRTLRYDLFGRGYSDRPDVAYGMHLYLEQLDQLLNALGLHQADLIGLSMGGPIAAAFAVSHPHRIGRLVLIGPSGAEPINLGFLYRLAILPGIGDALFQLVGNEHMLNAIARDFFDPASVDVFRERYRKQMEFHGFRRAILSTVRCNMLADFEGIYARLGQLGKRILLIWGEDDRTVPFAQSRRMHELLPHAEFMPVVRCGHIPHFERPDLVNPRLLDFLN